MNLAQAKDRQVKLIVKSMLSNNIAWKAFSDFKEPLRSQLKCIYKEDKCIVVVVVREDADEEDPIYAVGVLKVPGSKKDTESSDYGSDDESDHVTDEEIDYDIGVMVVGVNPSENTDDETDVEMPNDSDDDDDDDDDVVDEDDDSENANDDDDSNDTDDESDDDSDEDIDNDAKNSARVKPNVAKRKKIHNASFYFFSSR